MGAAIYTLNSLIPFEVGKNETFDLRMEELFYLFKDSLKYFEEMNFMIYSLHVFPHEFEELKIEVFDFHIFLKFLMHKILIIFIFLMVMLPILVLRLFMLLRLILLLGFIVMKLCTWSVMKQLWTWRLMNHNHIFTNMPQRITTNLWPNVLGLINSVAIQKDLMNWIFVKLWNGDCYMWKLLEIKTCKNLGWFFLEV